MLVAGCGGCRLLLLVAGAISLFDEAAIAESPLQTGEFRWRSTQPVQAPAERPDDPCISVKDPTVVFHEGQWHLFTTIRSEKRSHQIEYSRFASWDEANAAPRHILRINDGYFCAPQVFYYRPQQRWYLIYQAANKSRPVSLQPAFSTTVTLADPDSWTSTAFLYDEHPENIKGWIDFWVICDDAHAHLFFTSNNGKFWRAETRLADFPKGWSKPEIAYEGDIFEASCTYKVQGENRFLTLIEAIGGGRRYFKVYTAESLNGKWSPLADTLQKPFAALGNVKFDGPQWAESISHGELLRAGVDERLEVAPDKLTFLYQGVLDKDIAGRPYGKIPWRLGLLRAE